MEFEEEIKKRKDQLVVERDKLISQFERQMAYYEGAIRELEALLALKASMTDVKEENKQ
jgi:hypothetical protein